MANNNDWIRSNPTGGLQQGWGLPSIPAYLNDPSNVRSCTVHAEQNILFPAVGVPHGGPNICHMQVLRMKEV